MIMSTITLTKPSDVQTESTVWAEPFVKRNESPEERIIRLLGKEIIELNRRSR